MRLGDVCRVQNGFAFDGDRFSTEQGTPLIRIRDLKTNTPSLLYDGPFPAAYVVRRGDVLIGMDGEFRAYRWDGEDGLLNQRVCRLVPDGRSLDRNYLYFAIGEPLSDIERTTSLTTVKHLSSRRILDIEIPEPSLEDQRRIASLLARQRATVDVAISSGLSRRQAAIAIRERCYDLAFPGGVSLVTGSRPVAPKGWAWNLLTDLARLETGHTPSRRRPDWWGGDVSWIALPDIRRLDGQIAFSTAESTNVEGIANSSARILPVNTVVLSRTASVGFVTRMGRPMATSQDFVNWVCGPDLDPEFLMHLLIRSRDEIRALSSGAIHKTVYFPTVKAFRVCVPAIGEQRRLAIELRERLALIDAIEASIKAQQDAIDALPPALLRRAFEDVAA